MISVSVAALMSTILVISGPDMGPARTDLSGMLKPDDAEVTVSHHQWMESFEEARALAQQKKIPLLLHFEADWCGACRIMSSAVMSQDTVLRHLGVSVVAVRINADRHPDLISRYGIKSLPTEVVLSTDGSELRRYVGGTSLTDYVTRLENVRSLAPAENSGDGPKTTEADENLRPCLLVMREGQMVGLGGYSPVSMITEKKWIRGSENIRGTYLGVEYYFQSAEEREQFFASPENFIPRLHGCDPVELQLTRRAEAGVIELGAFYKGRLFFFMNEQNRKRFQSNPSWYADGVSFEGIQNADQFPFLKSMTLN